MADNKPDPSRIAAEAVGERPDNPPREFGKDEVRPDPGSAGPQARVAAKTAELVGERVGSAYADATPEEARRRSQQVAHHAAPRAGFQGGSPAFTTAFVAFALGYVAAFLLHARS